MRDISGSSVRRNDQQRDAWPQTKGVDMRRWDVIVEAAKIIPGEENRRARPIRSLHDGIDLLHGLVFSLASAGRRMFANIERLHQPAYRRQLSRSGIDRELAEIHYVARPKVGHADMPDGIEA